MKVTSSQATLYSSPSRGVPAATSTSDPADSFEDSGGSIPKALAFGALGAVAGAIPLFGAVTNAVGGGLAVGQLASETFGTDTSGPGAAFGAIGGAISQLTWGILTSNGAPAAIAIPVLFGALSWARVGYLGKAAHPDQWASF